MCPSTKCAQEAPVAVKELRHSTKSKYLQSQGLTSRRLGQSSHKLGAHIGQDSSFEEQKQALQKLWTLKTKATADNLPCQVMDGLYIGGIAAARNLKSLMASGVCYVLNVSPVVPCMHKQFLHYKVLHVYDDPEEDIAQYFEEANQFIAEGRQQGGVLVHCYAGQSRSAAYVMAYLLGECGMKFSSAWSAVKRARPQARPNVGFMQQLLAYAHAIDATADCDNMRS